MLKSSLSTTGKVYRISERCLAAILIFALVSLLTGCGSSNSSSVFTGTSGQSPSTGQNADGFFMGRVLLEDFQAGDQVVVTSLEGTPLFEMTTNSSGVFYDYGRLPLDFRIKARRNGENIDQFREIRGGYTRGTMYINPLTTLTSLLMQADPTITLEDAEARVRAEFDLPAGYDFDWVTNAEVSPFRPAEFYQAAEANGGIASYYQQILGNLQNPIAAAEDGSAALSLVKTLGGDVLSDSVSLVDAGIFGAVTQALGLNFGTSDALKQISEQLDLVQQELTDLTIITTQDSISAQYTSDEQALTPILNGFENFTTTLQTSIGDESATAPDQSELGTLVDNIETVAEFMIGDKEDNFIYTYLDYLTNVDNVMNAGTDFQHYPVRRNGITSAAQSNFRSILTSLSLGLNQEVEYAHMGTPPVDQQLDTAVNVLDQTGAATLQAQAQIPPQLSSDDLLIDMSTGDVWVTAFQPEDIYYNANNIATNWQEGGWDYFSLAPRAVMDNFVQNRIGGVKTGTDNDGWETGFQRYGFDTTNYGDQKYKQGQPGSNTNVQGQSFYDIGTNTSGNNQQNVYQWSGVNSAPATSAYDPNEYSDNDYSTYLIWHGLGQQIAYPEVGLDAPFPFNPLAYATLPSGTALSVSASGNQVSSSAVLKIGNVTYDVPVYDVTNLTYWSSSNPTMATVSNYPGEAFPSGGFDQGPAGQVNWHPPIDGSPLEAVTITGKFWGTDAGGSAGAVSVTGSVVVNPPNPAPQPNATSLQVLPFDPTAQTVTNSYDVSTIGDNTSYRFLVYTTTFYQDGQYHDVTSLKNPTTSEPEVTLTFLDPQGQVVDSEAEGGGFIDTTDNALLLYNNLPPGTYTIRATYTTPNSQNPQNLTGTIAFIVNGVEP